MTKKDRKTRSPPFPAFPPSSFSVSAIPRIRLTDCSDAAHRCGVADDAAWIAASPGATKYNAIERCWGVLENHWNGELLDETEAVLGFARTMTYIGKNPEVELVTHVYPKGVRLSRAEMNALEQRVDRDAALGKSFLHIDGRKTDLMSLQVP